MPRTLLLLLAIMLPATSPAETPGSTQRVAFQQYCFWTGEMTFGQFDGVVRTEAGYFQGHEVTLVDFDPAQISLAELAGKAKQAGVADRIYLPAGTSAAGREIAGVPVGARLDRSYRAAPASDQKKQLEGTPYAHLKLTPEQATKVNAFARTDPAKTSRWLAPAQRQATASGR